MNLFNFLAKLVDCYEQGGFYIDMAKRGYSDKECFECAAQDLIYSEKIEGITDEMISKMWKTYVSFSMEFGA